MYYFFIRYLKSEDDPEPKRPLFGKINKSNLELYNSMFVNYLSFFFLMDGGRLGGGVYV